MREVEAKFLIQKPDQFDRVLDTLDALGYRVTAGPTDLLDDRYFDTADWSILRAGWCYRRRIREGSEKLTLKEFAPGQGPVFVRKEIEQEMPAPAPQRRYRLPPGPVQERLQEIDGGRKRELFRVRSRRRIYEAEAPDDDATRIEIGLDRTRIRARKPGGSPPGTMEFTELELELRSGQADIVRQLADVLRDKVGLKPAHLSKFDRGIQTAGLRIPDFDEPVEVAKPGPDDPLPGLIYRYLGRQVRMLKLQEPRAWEGIDPAGVHQMRVAIRRFRSILRIFRWALPDTADHLNDELRWLAKTLGYARDADVLGEAIPCYRDVIADAAPDGLASYDLYVNDAKLGAYAELTAVLDSDRYAGLVRELERLLADGPTRESQQRYGSLSISDGAAGAVQSAVERVLLRGRKIRKHSLARDLHKLRIDAKRLRYLLDFLGEAEPRRWGVMNAAVRELQDLLGPHQDACMACAALEDCAKSIVDRDSDALPTMRRLVEFEEQRVRTCREEIPAAWAAFEKIAERI